MVAPLAHTAVRGARSECVRAHRPAAAVVNVSRRCMGGRRLQYAQKSRNVLMVAKVIDTHRDDMTAHRCPARKVCARYPVAHYID
jgi:hypothetical protein